jgi:serine/threonine-protein kinase
MSLAAGTRLGPYEVLGPLGAGGMGEVYKARDPRLERDVALKVLPAATLTDPTARPRLLREARLASKLNHPHICTIHDVGEAQDQMYIGMELVEGQTLADRLQGGPLPADEVVRYGQQMAGALAHAHARDVVHRDFKSGNVVVTPDGQVKVLDFGLAKQLATAESAAATTLAPASLTEAGVVAGTLAYMAPEQLLGRPADARSDLWALGVVLYELVAGQRPFQGTTGFELSHAILSQPAPTVPAAVSAPLAAVIDRCLAKEPAERYQHASEVQAALDAVASGQALAAWPTWRRLRRRHRGLVAAGASLVLLLAVASLLVAFDVGGVRSRLVRRPATAARIVKLAVLPFANVSGDAEQEYLSDGLTTEMTALLGRLHPETLRVIARTTAMRYKKTDKAIDQIGRELGVDYVLEGSAQREAGRIRITADLIKVADQTQLWAERYERELAGILVLQNDVAQQVAKALALKLLPAEQARLAGAKTVDPEVYDLCLKGLYYTERLSKADLDTAERYFQLALAKDRASAVAHAGMAMVWACRQQMGITPARESGPKAKAAVLEAVRLDDTLSKAHSTLGSILAWTDFNFPEAAREYRRSIELDPNDTNARAAYSLVLMILQRPDEAMPQIERAVAIDPLNAFNLSFYAVDLICARRYDEALSQARAALRVQPDAPAATSALILALHLKNLHDEAIATSAATYAGSTMGWPDVAEALKKGYAESGYAAALRRAAELETAKYGDLPGVAIDAANNYAMAGDNPRALDWLEKAYEQRDPNVPYISCMPIFDALRSEPRFKALLRQMNLPQ